MLKSISTLEVFKRVVQKIRHGHIRWGQLRSLDPLNSEWGFDRGLPIDRYYILDFLSNHAADIHGSVLSVGDDHYAKKFGCNIDKSEILHIHEEPMATIVGDLQNPALLEAEAHDCFLLVQTLQLIYDCRIAVANSYRALKPGGVLLATVPGITPMKDPDWNDAWCWSFTRNSILRIFEESFPEANIQIKAYGNVLTATAFLNGLGKRDLRTSELNYQDQRFDVIIGVRAEKPM